MLFRPTGEVLQAQECSLEAQLAEKLPAENTGHVSSSDKRPLTIAEGKEPSSYEYCGLLKRFILDFSPGEVLSSAKPYSALQ